MEATMDLKFDLKTVRVEINGNPDEGGELYIDGVHGPSVLDQMMSQYEDIGIGVRTSALHIADLVFSAGQTIDKTTAERIAQEMAMLALDMLREEGALEWDTSTRLALTKVRGTNPDVAELAAAE
jgi:hypothetical protein